MTSVADLAGEIVDFYAERAAGHQVIIGVDGPDCSGKTTLATAIWNRAVKDRIESGIVHADDYLFDLAVRYARGEFAVEGFVCNYFDWSRLHAEVSALTSRASRGLIIVEGLFLASPGLGLSASAMIRLEAPEDIIMERALQRDVGKIGTREWVEKHYMSQCMPAQRIYRHLVRPEALSDWVIAYNQRIGESEIVKRPYVS